jgi:hypothetical protein
MMPCRHLAQVVVLVVVSAGLRPAMVLWLLGSILSRLTLHIHGCDLVHTPKSTQL